MVLKSPPCILVFWWSTDLHLLVLLGPRWSPGLHPVVLEGPRWCVGTCRDGRIVAVLVTPCWHTLKYLLVLYLAKYPLHCIRGNVGLIKKLLTFLYLDKQKY